jgi:DNA-binding MarR family transcriptional regulator
LQRLDGSTLSDKVWHRTSSERQTDEGQGNPLRTLRDYRETRRTMRLLHRGVISQVDNEILQLLYFGKPCSVQDFCKETGLSKETVRQHLRRLESEGFLERERHLWTLSTAGNVLARKLRGKRLFTCSCGAWLAARLDELVEIECPNCGQTMRS